MVVEVLPKNVMRCSFASSSMYFKLMLHSVALSQVQCHDVKFSVCIDNHVARVFSKNAFGHADGSPH